MECVNALHRAIPISTYFWSSFRRSSNPCVNALHRAIPISTGDGNNVGVDVNGVSMPYIGLSPFLQHLMWSRKSLQQQCVNALHRAIPISTSLCWCIKSDGLMCQCPSSGYPHFYFARSWSLQSAPEVSMPFIGLSPFLLQRVSSFTKRNYCVSIPFIGLSPFLRLS